MPGAGLGRVWGRGGCEINCNIEIHRQKLVHVEDKNQCFSVSVGA